MINALTSLRVMVSLLVAAAFLTGATALWLWTSSNAHWRLHQNASYGAGQILYYTMQIGIPPPANVTINTMTTQDQFHAANGAFQQIDGAPRAPRVTIVPILAGPQNRAAGGTLTLAILSPDITYKLADLPHREGQTAAETTGEVFRKLASFCSDPMVVAKMGDQPWVQISGADVWGCDAAPPDRRLIAGLLAIIAICILMTIALNLSSSFATFAQQLRNRRRVGGPASYDIVGPQELQDIVAAVNSYLEVERTQLEQRAAVLSGVSHDLGAPATRLRLRAALISDPELRQKLETDIDMMTGIIESVLTYTRTEMGVEAPRKLSLNSLVDAIVADYQDLGRSVTLRQPKDVVVQGGRSVFMSKQGQTVVSSDRDIIVFGRPISLARAITNLIENALKYGRRATVTLEADAHRATVVIEDEGSDNSARDIEALMAPFQRGENTTTIDGYGLGLTIVATIAKLHGGALSFEDTTVGVSARLTIDRN